MGKYGQYRALVAAVWVALSAGPVSACRLALVLAMDVSSSVDAEEDALQRSGLAAALEAPEIIEAFLQSPDPVALIVFEWSGRENHHMILPWTEMDNAEAIRAAARAIAQSKRSRNDMPTALGHALGYASILLKERADCLFHTIDVAGDGVNNESFGPEEAYNAFPFDGVVVNGLMVDTGAYGDSTELVDFYFDEVRRGPAAFVEVAQGFDDYERAMRRKLLRELQVQIIGSHSDPTNPSPG